MSTPSQKSPVPSRSSERERTSAMVRYEEETKFFSTLETEMRLLMTSDYLPLNPYYDLSQSMSVHHQRTILQSRKRVVNKAAVLQKSQKFSHGGANFIIPSKSHACCGIESLCLSADPRKVDQIFKDLDPIINPYSFYRKTSPTDQALILCIPSLQVPTIFYGPIFTQMLTLSLHESIVVIHHDLDASIEIFASVIFRDAVRYTERKHFIKEAFFTSVAITKELEKKRDGSFSYKKLTTMEHEFKEKVKQTLLARGEMGISGYLDISIDGNRDIYQFTKKYSMFWKSSVDGPVSEWTLMKQQHIYEGIYQSQERISEYMDLYSGPHSPSNQVLSNYHYKTANAFLNKTFLYESLYSIMHAGFLVQSNVAEQMNRHLSAPLENVLDLNLSLRTLATILDLVANTKEYLPRIKRFCGTIQRKLGACMQIPNNVDLWTTHGYIRNCLRDVGIFLDASMTDDQTNESKNPKIDPSIKLEVTAALLAHVCKECVTESASTTMELKKFFENLSDTYGKAKSLLEDPPRHVVSVEKETINNQRLERQVKSIARESVYVQYAIEVELDIAMESIVKEFALSRYTRDHFFCLSLCLKALSVQYDCCKDVKSGIISRTVNEFDGHDILDDSATIKMTGHPKGSIVGHTAALVYTSSDDLEPIGACVMTYSLRAILAEMDPTGGRYEIATALIGPIIYRGALSPWNTSIEFEELIVVKEVEADSFLGEAKRIVEENIRLLLSYDGLIIASLQIGDVHISLKRINELLSNPKRFWQKNLKQNIGQDVDVIIEFYHLKSNPYMPFYKHIYIYAKSSTEEHSLGKLSKVRERIHKCQRVFPNKGESMLFSRIFDFPKTPDSEEVVLNEIMIQMGEALTIPEYDMFVSRVCLYAAVKVDHDLIGFVHWANNSHFMIINHYAKALLMYEKVFRTLRNSNQESILPVAFVKEYTEKMLSELLLITSSGLVKGLRSFQVHYAMTINRARELMQQERYFEDETWRYLTFIGEYSKAIVDYGTRLLVYNFPPIQELARKGLRRYNGTTDSFFDFPFC